jgi:hypothetical protein
MTITPTKYTHVEIDALQPCRPASTWISEDWSGTLLDIMRLPQVSDINKVWVFSRLGSDRDLRLFGVWCARQVLALQESPDPRSLAAVEVAYKYAMGEATIDELSAAESAAWSAAESAARSAASAAWSAASAAWSVARREQVSFICSLLELNQAMQQAIAGHE